jgi:hypothetical protein
MMRAKIDGIDVDPGIPEFKLKVSIHLVDLLFARQAARDNRLIGDDDQQKTGVP